MNRSKKRVLTAQQVREIRRLYEQHPWPYRETAKVYGVAHMTIARVVRRDTYRHITD